MRPPQSTAISAPAIRGGVRAAGPWFRDALGRKVFLRGVTYGPFKPGEDGLPWPAEDRLRADFAHIHALGFDTVRLYEPPTEAVLQACEDNRLRLLCGVPWSQHGDFMADQSARDEALHRMAQESRRLASYPCVAGLLVGNEIEKTLVRWMGPRRVLEFIEALIRAAKMAAPGMPVSYASYPSTEYLIPRQADFIAFNVFLEQREAFARYVQRLQNLAAGRPLVLTEFGLDSRSHGEAVQAETFCWHREVCENAGVAGTFWFTYTDEWHTGGAEVRDWEFGLVRRDRSAKRVCDSIKNAASSALREPDATPSISVIVCTRNGSATLRPCLEALGRQTLAACEVLVIDDGSTDATPDIARSFASVRYERQEHAGLSAARNLGMRLASGELLAYTDDDCIPDEDWLRHVCRAFEDAQCVAAGGPNLPPPPRNAIEACVGLAPGAPSQVLLDDFEAEHLPGCNLVIRKSALRAIGGFREEFTAAGDDVDVCWRLQAHGGKLRFVPAAVVWHHRRRTVRGYLRQQRGYGRAEALLIRHYPDRFAWLGGARWRGKIYGDAPPHLLHSGAVIEFGRFGQALFQTVYASNAPGLWDWMSGLPWCAATFLAGAFTLLWSPAWIIGAVMLALMMIAAWRRTRVLPAGTSVVSTRQLSVLWLLCLLQPIIRDWGRLSGMVRLHAWPRGRVAWPGSWSPGTPPAPHRHRTRMVFWSDGRTGREELLHEIRRLAPEHGLVWSDADEWSACDGTLSAVHGWHHMAVATVTEFYGVHGRRTRVAFHGWRPWWPSVGLWLAGPVLFIINSWTCRLAGLLLLSAAVVSAFRAHAAARALIRAAAQHCGLRDDAPGHADAVGEPREPVLATTAQAAEVCWDKP